MMTKKGLLLRPGVADVIHYALDNNVLLAFVTSTSEANVDAVFLLLGIKLSAMTLASWATT